MRIGRTLPPAASPIGLREIASGVCGLFRGRKVLDRFQSELKVHFGVKHCFLVSSGKAAFTLILLALKELGPNRDEVLIPAFTCYSVPSSVVRAKLRIRLCDLDPECLDYDFAQLSSMLSEASRPRQADSILAGGVANLQGATSATDGDSWGSTQRLLAVVSTHLFGFPADVARLKALVRDPGVAIVEDAAQAMGETCDGRKLGTFGDVSFFSLGRGKAFSTVEGGIILTDRDDIAEALERHVGSLPHYGSWKLMSLISKALGLMLFSHPLLFWIPRSMPFLRLGETLFEPHFPMLQMSAFQAGLAANWRDRLQTMRDARKANVRLWLGIHEAIGNRALCFQGPQALGLLRFPIRIHDVEKRKTLLQESTNKGAGVASVYPESINRLSELREEIRAEAFPVAESCAREIVTLPTHRYLTREDVAVVRGLLSHALAVRDYQSP